MSMKRARTPQRTAQVDRGLRVMVAIVDNVRQSVGAVDDPAEEAAIDAAYAWIRQATRYAKRPS